MRKLTSKYTKEEFENKSKNIHRYKNNKPIYDYSKVIYVNSKTKVIIICPIHGEFLQIPNHHLSGSACAKCAGVGVPTQEEFIKKSKHIHKNEYGESKYDYSKTLYINASTKVNIICPNHGEFLQVANYHLRGNGCPTCKKSKGEMKILEFLTKNKIENVRNKKFNNCINILPLPFDFFLPEYNLCIEYDGELHYKLSGFKNAKERLENTKKNDKIKDKYCHNNNIYIIRIPYWNFDKIEFILKNELHNIKHILPNTLSLRE